MGLCDSVLKTGCLSCALKPSAVITPSGMSTLRSSPKKGPGIGASVLAIYSGRSCSGAVTFPEAWFLRGSRRICACDVVQRYPFPLPVCD